MRQAYDYWQDQPGNYFPFNTNRTRRGFPGRWSSSTIERIRLQHIHGFCLGILTVSGPAIEPPCHRSHIFQTHFSLSLFQTEIMAYGEDYQQPASYTEISCTVTADLQVYSCKRALLSARNPHPTFIASKHHKGAMLECTEVTL